MEDRKLSLGSGDVLLIVDLQRDFLPGGRLPVAGGEAVVPVLNAYIEAFQRRGLSIYATRDWHPSDHCSFRPMGGAWPQHCVAGSEGAEFAADLRLPPATTVVSKATGAHVDAYSGFSDTDLAARLRAAGAARLFVGGLATDYCVLHTVQDALREGFEVVLLRDAVRAVNLAPGDGGAAERRMAAAGAQSVTRDQLGVA